MSENSNQITSAEQFQSITDKRLALESLIKIAMGVHSQQKALNELVIAARPSQKFPKQVASYFNSIKKRLADETVEQIIVKLDAIESSIQKSLKIVLKLASLDADSLREGKFDNINVESFTQSIDQFKKRTQTGLALRYVLQQRGVAIPAFQLPFSQEDIHEQIEHLKHKEHQCINQIKIEIQTIIQDTELMIKQEALSEAMKFDLIDINQAMWINLEHLESGGSVTEIPNVFEIIVLESKTPFSSVETASEIERPDDEKANPASRKPKIPKKVAEKTEVTKLSFLQRLKIWLKSPWSTSWSSIKRRANKK